MKQDISDYFESLEYLANESHSVAAELGAMLEQAKSLKPKYIDFDEMKQLANKLMSLTKKIKNIKEKSRL
jgi:hypothetical protein